LFTVTVVGVFVAGNRLSVQSLMSSAMSHLNISPDRIWRGVDSIGSWILGGILFHNEKWKDVEAIGVFHWGSILCPGLTVMLVFGCRLSVVELLVMFN